MIDINNLFCTPDQGRRLKELVPELESAFVWKPFQFEGMSVPDYTLIQASRQKLLSDMPLTNCLPALTLQELRDLYEALELGRRPEFYGALSVETTPEITAWVIERAAWVIERLE